MPRNEDFGRPLNSPAETEVVRGAESEGWHSPEDRDWEMRGQMVGDGGKGHEEW
jgi:hypothetical protein